MSKITNDIPKKVIKAVKEGMNSPFWTDGLKKVLEDYIQILTDKITGDISIVEGENENDLKSERRAYKNLLTLPEKILEDEKENKNPPKDENKGIADDPYD
jgi:uncharacterized protein with gpF-like domain